MPGSEGLDSLSNHFCESTRADRQNEHKNHYEESSEG
jgi:hypothetical protein